ncbi:SusC/RagA family TonB-linked outer membrane protein [Tenacibaculum halocynthiae]|uniref:SusC/RagA family TonB-linked outer membrane protein n=1 Tax=Tenacibaculum halocynthiae TaxID=1254437 RepID=UPI00389589AB
MRTKFNGILTLLLAFLVHVTYAQDKVISGSVSDESGPLPGVTILKKGTTQGTETDFDGNYSLKVKVGDVLVYSFVGMKSEERTVGSANSINVKLENDNVLEEIIVTGYGTVKKNELTGSTVQINAEDIEQVPVASIDQVLQGKVAGLTLNSTSGTPGSVQNIRIRGISSITAGNEPLYVIDGVPMSNPNLAGSNATSSFTALSSISVDDIQSVTVLKDASATSAYGARGANGVIVITTKKGKTGKVSINVTSSVGFSNDAVDGPQMLTTAQREELYLDGIFNTYGAAQGFTRDQAQSFYNANLGFFGSQYKTWNDNGRTEYNWSDLITNKNAVTKSYGLSATGGDAISNFYASLSLFQAEATVIGSDFERFTAAFRYSRQLSDKFKLETSLTGSNSVQDGLLEQSAYFSSPRAAKYFMNPTNNPYNADGSINISNLAGSVRNPLYIAENDVNLNKTTRLIANTSLTWDTPIENLKFTTRFNMDFIVNDYTAFQNPIHGDGVSVGGSATRDNTNIVNYTAQNSLDYILNLGEDTKVDIKLLQEFQKNKRNYFQAYGEGFSVPGLQNLNSAAEPKGVDGTFTDWSIASYLAMANFTHKNKYILSTTVRREGSSRFPTNSRWGTFWSVGGAWNIHKESFMGSLDFINSLRLRTSYGKSGNANIGLNLYQSKFAFAGAYNGSGNIRPSSFGNPNLSWEIAKTLDIGLEFSMFDSRLNSSVSYYKRKTSELLLDVPLSSTSGFTSQYANAGSMENKGIEVELSYDVVRNNDLKITIGGNLATVDNKVLELPKDGNGVEIGPTTGTRAVSEGRIVREWFMRKEAGIDPQTGERLYYINGNDGATTNDYNVAQRGYQGTSALPTLTAGLNFNLDYKGFFISANAFYAGGHQVYESWSRYTIGGDRFSTDFFNGINVLLDRWQKPGDIARFPKITHTAEPWRTHTGNLYDGDYLRLKDLTAGYNLSSELLDKIGMDAVRIFVKGTNLYTWVKDDRLKYDPEVDIDGFSNLTTPPVKTVSLGVNLKF